MADLRAAILERVDQLEALARAARGDHGWTGPWTVAPDPEPGRVRILAGPGDWEGGKPRTRVRDVAPPVAEHMATWDPAAVLTLCAGTRKLAELHRPDDIVGVHCETCQVAYQCQTIREVARMLGIDPDSGQT